MSKLLFTITEGYVYDLDDNITEEEIDILIDRIENNDVPKHILCDAKQVHFEGDAWVEV